MEQGFWRVGRFGWVGTFDHDFSYPQSNQFGKIPSAWIVKQPLGDLAIKNDFLFLSPVGTLGGAERVLINLLRSLGKAFPDIQPRVICLGGGPLVEELTALGFPVSLKTLPGRLGQLGDSPAGKQSVLTRLARLVFSGPAILRVIFQWKKWLRREKPLIIHSNGFKTHLLSAWSAPADIPIFWHLHDFVGERPLMRRLLKQAWRPGIQALAISRAVAADFSKQLPNCPVRIWHNTVDSDKFQPRKIDGRWLDVEAGLVDGFQGMRIGLVATYAKWKGHDVFLRACQILMAKFKDCVRFYLIGGPVYQTAGSQWTIEELRESIRDLKLVGRVGLVPFQKDTSKVYQSLDVVVHASTRPEPFGLVIAEGMACGRPVVAALHGGASEIGEDGIHCVGHEPGNSASLAAAMEGLIQDEASRKELGAKARDRVLNKFGAEKMLDNWGILLGEVGIH